MLRDPVNWSKPARRASLCATRLRIHMIPRSRRRAPVTRSELIGPEEITDKQRLNIGAATFFSGHHTVYQHAHFEFGLENVSRQFVWSFLHAHPFYNSEQQSQRYVRLIARMRTCRLNRFSSMMAAGKFTNAPSRAPGSITANSPRCLHGDAREILNDIWHIGPTPIPIAFRKSKVRRKARRSKSLDTFCRRGVHDDGAHCLRHRAASPVADVHGIGHAERSARSHRRDGRSSSAKSIRNFLIASAPNQSRQLPEWGERANVAAAMRLIANGTARHGFSWISVANSIRNSEGRTSRLIDYSARRRRGSLPKPIARSSDSPKRNAPTPKPLTACSIPRATFTASRH